MNHNRVLDNIMFIILIAARRQKDALLTEISNVDCRIVNVVYGKGTVKGNYLVEMLGFIPDESKVVITCVLPSEKVEALFSLLLNKFKFGLPNTGIAFTLPISGISF